MSWIDERVVAGLEARWGRPREVAIVQPVGPEVFAPFEASIAKRRRHDVTLFIRCARGLFAVIRKPSYPPGVFRPPSGGVEPGEDFEAGARREPREETGLDVALERYVLRVRATFAFAGRPVARGEAAARPAEVRTEPWTAHIFLA